MPEATYESLPGSVLAFKKAHKIGRFDPNASEIETRKAEQGWAEVEKRSRYFAVLHGTFPSLYFELQVC